MVTQMANKTWRQGLAGIILAGSLAGLSGCTGAAVLGDMAQVSPHTTPGVKMLGRGASTYGRMEHEKDVARIGKTEVNVNVGSKGRENMKTYEITNLNTNETVLYTGKYTNYFDNIRRTKGFPSKGFKIGNVVWTFNGKNYMAWKNGKLILELLRAD